MHNFLVDHPGKFVPKGTAKKKTSGGKTRVEAAHPGIGTLPSCRFRLETIANPAA
jgi:hypothetical protein